MPNPVLHYGVLLPFSDLECETTAEPEIIPPAKTGRETAYNPELGLAIADRLAAGETLRQICRAAGMPSERTVRRWAMNEAHPFAKMYEAARRIGYDGMADEIVEIADDGRNDWIERELRNGDTIRIVDTEAVMRSRLRVDTRKWILAKALPKRYGNLPPEIPADGNPFAHVLKAISDGRAAYQTRPVPVEQIEDAEIAA